MPAQIKTPLTELLNIKHPIMLAGMSNAAGPELAAAVTNAGGIGVIGGVGYTPKYLQKLIADLKADLKDPENAIFGVDLLLPQVGGSARKTNKDYTGGQLDQLVDVIIAGGAKLFVAAVGVPPKEVVDKLHKHGILVANMVGAPKHVKKAIERGVDLIVAQAGEGGGHTGVIPFSVMIPAVVDVIEQAKAISPLTGKPVQVVAAGAVHRGSSLAAALSYGATGVWVGTRFVNATEAGASRAHQEAIIKADENSTRTTLIYTGRPLRVIRDQFSDDWEDNRAAEIKRLADQGKLAVGMDDPEHRPFLSGQVASVINDVKPAAQIIDEMVEEAAVALNRAHAFVSKI